MSRLTLLDIAKLNLGDDEVGLVEEALIATPELGLFPVKTISGINYYTKVRTALPSVSFRNANEGVTATKSTFENRLVETYILNPRWEIDKAVADRDKNGPGMVIAEEAVGILQGAFQTVCKQLYYGPDKGGDAKGFPGLLDAYDSANMAVDAGGTTADTGSSVWGVKFGPQATRLVIGMDGQLEMSDPRIETIYDVDDNPLTGWVQELLSYIGLQCATPQAIGRIKKLTADAGKTLTDDMLTDLYAKFKVGMKPDVWFMSRRSQAQLQKSRTATNPTGAPAPLPTDWNGIPIEVTDSILDTEDLAL